MKEYAKIIFKNTDVTEKAFIVAVAVNDTFSTPCASIDYLTGNWSPMLCNIGLVGVGLLTLGNLFAYYAVRSSLKPHYKAKALTAVFD
jgi:hypothetical protein